MVLWMSLILWFTRCSCALKESMESKESVSGSGKLWTDALGVGIGRLATSPKRAWSDSEAGHRWTGSLEAALLVAVVPVWGREAA
ncbi:hypothetical protein BHE74_00030597 [Ensete ventricosum]|nr:hypothetical protein BHE74_00030597 [Ensete ventricosum]